MIRGRVNAALEAIVPVGVLGPRSAITTEVIIDTGFDGALALPPALVARLGLQPAGHVGVVLGDGSETTLTVDAAEIDWPNRRRIIDVIEADGGNLLGTALLRGTQIRIDFTENGAVEIDKLQP